MSAACSQTGNQVEGEETEMPHAVLDVVPEDPQEPHVGDQVHPTAVHEHAGEHGDGREAAKFAGWQTGRQLDDTARTRRQLGGDGAVNADGAGQRRYIQPGALNQEPDGDIGSHEKPRDEWREGRRVLVTQRKQVMPPV